MYPDYKKVVFPYTNKDESVTWVVEFPDLPGCSAVGKTEESSLQESKIAAELWLDEYYENNKCYPIPKVVINSYSGKLVLRLPKTLHKQLAGQAAEEGVSLNSLIMTLLAQNYVERISKPAFHLSMNQKISQTDDHHPASKCLTLRDQRP